eukprot:TRINITY_DN1408_c0_g1_i1.p1 TRINITY_DN1408_c0_g1~~TRINITY_DN1408_c0_g1_i1.p1  ORF type:complete len:148 (+),score=23.44 TRINITY_DN1408_c0_g1_i1:92-535(+)
MAHVQNSTVQDLIAHQQLVVVSPKETLERTFAVMLKHNIRHLPVVNDQGEVVGMISDRDIRLAADSPILNKDAQKIVDKLAKIHVEQVMSTSLVTVDENSPILEAAKLMRVSKVGGLPVLKPGTKLCTGCLTTVDLVDQLIRILEPL